MLKKFIMIFAILFWSLNFSDTYGASPIDEENTEESSDEEETSGEGEEDNSSEEEATSDDVVADGDESKETDESAGDVIAEGEESEETVVAADDAVAEREESEEIDEEETPIAKNVTLIRSQFNPKTCPKIQGFIGDDPEILKSGKVSVFDGKKIFKLSSRYSGTGSDVSLNDVNVVDENGSPLRQGEGLAIRFGPKTNNVSAKTLKRLHKVLLSGNYKTLTTMYSCGYYHPDDLDEAIAYVFKVRVKETF
jgi:hypothetical protein